MKRVTLLIIAIGTLAGVFALKARASRHTALQEAAPIFSVRAITRFRLQFALRPLNNFASRFVQVH